MKMLKYPTGTGLKKTIKTLLKFSLTLSITQLVQMEKGGGMISLTILLENKEFQQSVRFKWFCSVILQHNKFSNSKSVFA